MAKKRRRTKNISSGAHKAARTGKNLGRRSRPIGDVKGLAFLKHQALYMHPSDWSKDKAWELLQDKTDKASVSRERPKPLAFPLLETLAQTSTAAVSKLLTAASLRMKRSRRFPGWYLQKTYNHGMKVIEII